MICVSICRGSFERIVEILGQDWCECAELRLDRLDITDGQIREIFEGTDKPLVATCRLDERPDATHRLTVAAKAGAAFIDLEVDAPVAASKYIQRVCRDNGVELIRSFHDFEGTPDAALLEQVVERCFRYGGDIAKVVTTAAGGEDLQRLYSLYTEARRGRIIAFAMGEAGRESRLECLRRGAPFSYASVDAESAGAAGQQPADIMYKEVYKDVPGYFRTGLRMPSSKSFVQRAVIAAALAEGESRLRGYTPCGDSESAIKAARALGAEVTRNGDELTIKGISPINDKLTLTQIDAGESGLLARLLIPILAAIGPGEFGIGGRGTLLSRPLPLSTDIMASFGVLLSRENIPLKVKGRLIPGFAEISGKGGSQLISGLLMASPLCTERAAIVVDEPASIPYMYMTLDVLKRFGVHYCSEMEGDVRILGREDWDGCEAISFRLKSGSYRAADVTLETDWSAAANFLVAGAVFGHVEIEGLDSSSLQADLSILDILVEAGANVSEDEERKIISVGKGPLRGFSFDLSNAPDLFPITAVLAAFCEGTTTLFGTDRLHAKESDRLRSIMEMMERFGVAASYEGDVLTIEGHTLASRALSGNLLKGGLFPAHSDHRVAMAIKVASLGASSPVDIDSPDCVEKSFPGFFEAFG